MSSANIYELRSALSTLAQPDITTPANAFFSVKSTSADPLDIAAVKEDDAAEIGKEHEFATQSFLVAWNSSKKLQVYCSAELLGFAAAYGLGAGTGGTYVPQAPTTDGIELPLATFVETIRQGTNPLTDRVAYGMCVEQFKWTIGSGPGRANSRLEIDLSGSGKWQQPSGIAMPALTPVHLLPAAAFTLTMGGVDYVAQKNFVSGELTWKNNIRLNDGFFPGSGYNTAGDPTSGQVRGRMEFGEKNGRELMFSCVVRMQENSPEFATLTGQTQGPITFGTTGAPGYSASVTIAQAIYKGAKVTSTNGIATVAVDITPIKDPTADLVTISVTGGGTYGRG